MKKGLWALGLAGMLAQTAGGWRPSEWVYTDWPWAYDAASGHWHWFNSADTQWVNGFPPAEGWRTMAGSGLAAGWAYYQWPYAYCQNNGAWYWMNEPDVQWVRDMTAGAWGQFGVPPAPIGMVWVRGGKNEGTDPDYGAYSLTVASFYMDRCEVTLGLWGEVRVYGSGTGYSDLREGIGKGTGHPVGGVSWHDAVKWCNARSEKEGREPVYYADAGQSEVYKSGTLEPFVKETADGYRLPTETEWQYAARGGAAGRRFSWGDSDEIQHDRANYKSNEGDVYDTSPTRGYHPTYYTGGIPYSAPVGSFAANGYGLQDMTGNVSEWCYDWAPQFIGHSRVIHGGSWYDDAYYARIGYRSMSPPLTALHQLGFRTALHPGP